ncbi:cell division protein FtsQ/DivIB [Kocuria rhizophila]|uniref:cell division protein FtsQ/DivIB n=1 Tax=Kocuria rhizophila TaxID=72000 RepID=UPI000F533A79|nr:FtsQ-type POTRA domain-containing protein [Kocuria rhizophila]
MTRSVPPHQPSFDGHDAASEDRDAPGFPRDSARDPGSGSTAAGRAPRAASAGHSGNGGGAADDPGYDAARGASAGGGTTAQDELPLVRVNDETKVSRVDTGQLEAVPEAGGRFSSWRARRRAAREQDVGQEGELPGTEEDPDGTTVVRLPRSAHQRRRRRRLLTLLVSLLVLMALVLVVFFSPLFATRTIDVQGATLTDPQKVEEALSGFQGVPMTRISKQEVKDAVGDVPQVKSVDVAFQPPHTISVQLHERVGVAVVEDGSSVVLVDSEGKPLSSVPAERRPDVPLVEGGTQVLSTPQFQAISDVLATLPADVLARLDSASAPSGSTVELTMKDGPKVVWGDSSDSDVKAQVVATLVNSGQLSDSAVVDVSAPLHPVVT